MRSGLILIILAVLSLTGMTAQYDPDKTDYAAIEEDTEMKTEAGTIVEINDDICVLVTRSEEIYQIHNFSSLNISAEEGEEIIFTYTDKTAASDGKYDIVVDWIDKWERFSPENMVNGL